MLNKVNIEGTFLRVHLKYQFSKYCNLVQHILNRKMAPNIGDVKEELRNITTLNFIASTSSILEKIFWALIAILGTLFIYDVVYIQLENWKDNPTLVTREMKKLSDMPLPSMTFCHKGLQKYGPVEHFGNFIDPEKEIPEEVFAIRNEFLKVQFEKIKVDLSNTKFCEWLFEGDDEDLMPMIAAIPNDQIELLKSDCKVRQIISYKF